MFNLEALFQRLLQLSTYSIEIPKFFACLTLFASKSVKSPVGFWIQIIFINELVWPEILCLEISSSSLRVKTFRFPNRMPQSSLHGTAKDEVRLIWTRKDINDIKSYFIFISYKMIQPCPAPPPSTKTCHSRLFLSSESKYWPFL